MFSRRVKSLQAAFSRARENAKRMRSSSETGKVTSGRVSDSPRPGFLKSLVMIRMVVTMLTMATTMTMKIVLMIIQSQRAQKRNQKVCTRLLFNFWGRINIKQVDSLQHYVSNQHIIICVAETSISLMFNQPARKVKRVQRKMWILIITKKSIS